MTEPNAGPAAERSSRALLRSTLIAATVAVVLLFAAVLPAEYGVDPTGVGRVLGLTQMGEIKRALAAEVAGTDSAAADSADALAARGAPSASPADSSDVPAARDAVAAQGAASNSHVTVVTLQPNEGKEIKLAMAKGARTSYAWTTDGGVVNYDAHGDSTNAPNSYHSYKKGSSVSSDTGSVVAAFDGMHGWFWRNRSQASVTITLRTNGDYRELKRMD